MGSSLVWSSGRYTWEWLTRLTQTHLCRPYTGSMAKEGNLNRLEATMVETLWGVARRSATQFRSVTNRKLMLIFFSTRFGWYLTPPTGSHHGGPWERCIRPVRKVLNTILSQQILDDEGLFTLLVEVESIINSRPITQVSEDPEDLEALTPNHLLLLRSGVSLTPGIFSERRSLFK